MKTTLLPPPDSLWPNQLNGPGVTHSTAGERPDPWDLEWDETLFLQILEEKKRKRKKRKGGAKDE